MVIDMTKPGKGPGRGLTAKQQRFVEEYLADENMNATKAAIRAGYSKRSATQCAHENMKKPEIAAAIEAAIAERSKRTEISADWVLRRLAEEAEADLADILDEAGAIRPVKEWPKIWRQGLVSGIDVQEDMIEGVKVGQTVKLKLSDRIKRIELIGKHVNVGAFREKVEHSGPDGGPIQTIDVTKLSTEALREIMGAQNEAPDADGGCLHIHQRHDDCRP